MANMLIKIFEKTINSNSNKIAVIDGKDQITFKNLELNSKQLAVKLAEKNFINSPIAVFLPKSIESVVSNLAITYSGNIYMNLDIKTPESRLSNILKLIQPKLIITNKKYEAILLAMDVAIDIIVLDYIVFSNQDNYNILYDIQKRIIDTDAYCIINTSGSTGTPKGVVLNYKSFYDFIDRANDELQFGDEEIIGSLSPLVFDIYSFELCMLMTKSSTIVILPENLAAFPARILTLMQEHKVSFIFWVPTIMVNIANMELLSKIELINLKKVWFAGEVFPTKQFNYWKSNLSPGTMFVNLYGPIEITLDCTYFIVDRDIPDNVPIPIGFPFVNTDIMILDSKNQLVEGTKEGEICVRGTSLAMGYYKNPEKTKTAFVQNPLNNSYPELIYRTGDIVYTNSNGELVFKGRKDTLIKHMGYRIELGEIEHVIINNLKLVDNGCVLYESSKKTITLFYQALEDLSIPDFKKALFRVLPKYMVPTSYVRLDKMPMSTNGKIDRLSLMKVLSC